MIGRGCGRQMWAAAVPGAGSGEGQAGPWTLSECEERAEASSALTAEVSATQLLVLPQGWVGPESLHVSRAPRGCCSRVHEPREPHPRPGLGLPRLGGQSHMEGEKQTASVNFTVNSPWSTPTEGVHVRCQSGTEPLTQGGRDWSGFCDCWS